MKILAHSVLAIAVVTAHLFVHDGASAQPPAESASPGDRPPVPERGLFFNFQHEKWDRVLLWLAEQADLSLVLDAPPPGTFNYADTRGFTPQEAIDLLNGVLASKGYTLIQRGRMLTLANLQAGVPRELVPRVPLEEIDSHGRFELVTVAFPLDGRDVAEAEAEIQPLVSRFGEVLPLPASGQLVITDRAGVMQAIAAVIQSMPKPGKSSAPQPGEKPELRTYPLGGADPAAAIETLQKVLGGEFVHDPNTNKISAYVTPSQHNAIPTLIEQLQGASEAARFRIEIYPLPGLSATEQARLLEDLSMVSQTGVVRYDPSREQLLVWASNKEHMEIRRALLTLLAAGLGGEKRLAEVYRLAGGDAAAAIPLLQAVLPQAKLTRTPRSDRILAVATAEEHALLEKLISQLDLSTTDDDVTIRIHRLKNSPPATLKTVLQKLAPQADITIDTSKRTVTVTAAPKLQQTIHQVLIDLDESLQFEDNVALQIYVLDEVQRERFPSVRESIVQNYPDAKLVWSEDSSDLFVWAETEQQTAIQQLLDELRQSPPAETTRRVVAYPVRTSDLTGIEEMIKTIAPEAKVVADAKGRRVLVWATTKDHQAIEPVVQPASGDATRATEPLTYRSYQAGDIDASLAVQLLSDSFPGAEFKPDATARTIVAHATASEQLAIEQLIEQLREGSTAVNVEQVNVYPLGNLSTQRAESLRTLFPRMRIHIDAASGQVVAWGSTTEHAQFRGAIASLGENAAPTGGLLRVYDVGSTSALATRDLLTPMVPAATIVPDERASAVAVWASPAEHEQIRQALDGWRNKADQVVIYRLQNTRATEVAASLQQLLPQTTITTVGDNQVMVRGSIDHQISVAELLKQMDVDQSTGDDQRLVVYPVQLANATSLMSALQTLYPVQDGFYFSHDAGTRSILAIAPPARQPDIERLIAAADLQDSRAGGEQRVEVYALEGRNVAAVLSMLQNLLSERGSDSQLSVEATTNRLVAVARNQEHQLIAEVLDRLQPPQQLLEVFNLRTNDPNAAELAINRLLESNGGEPDVLVESDPDTGKLLVRGSARQIDDIRQLLIKMGETDLDNSQPTDDPARQSATTRFVPLESWQTDDLIGKVRGVWASLRSNELRVVGEQTSATTAPQPTNQAPPERPAEDSPLSNPEPSGDSASDSTNASPRADELPPVLLVPGPQGVTMMSDDTAALGQLETLFRELTRSGTASRQNFGVYPLKHASAERLASVLSRIYRRTTSRFGGGRLEIAADERINALVVVGRRSARREVEALLRVLDTDQQTELSMPSKPVMIPLEHADAEQVHDQIRTLYKTQLTAGGGRPPLEIPPGTDPDLVPMLQQINAAREGPLLSVDFDRESNSLLVMGARPLVQEIRQLASEMDLASSHSRVGLRVIALETLQGDQVIQSLKRIMGSR